MKCPSGIERNPTMPACVPADGARSKMATPRRPRDQTFRKTDLVRALRAAVAAGIGIAQVEIDPATGKIVIVTTRADKAAAGGSDLDGWLRTKETKDARPT